MGFLDGLFGATETKTDILTKSITNISNASITKASMSAAGAINQTQEVTFGGRAKGIGISQNAKVSLSAIKKTDVNTSMRADMIDKIKTELEKTKSDFPQITASKTSSSIQNIIEKNVSTTFSSESLESLSMTINNNQKVTFLKGSDSEDIKVDQTAEMIGKMSVDMSTKIVNELTAGTTIDTKAKVTTTNFLTDIVSSVGKNVNDIVGTIGKQFGFSQEMVFLFIVIVITSCILGLKQMDNKDSSTKPSYGTPPSVSSYSEQQAYQPQQQVYQQQADQPQQQVYQQQADQPQAYQQNQQAYQPQQQVYQQQAYQPQQQVYQQQAYQPQQQAYQQQAYQPQQQAYQQNPQVWSNVGIGK